MKSLVFLLVLANLLFYAYTEGYLGQPGNPDEGRLQQQLNREQIRIIAKGEPPDGKEAGGKEVPQAGKEVVPEKGAAAEENQPAVKEAAVPAKEAEAAPKPPAGPEFCMAWADLSGNEANRLADLLAEKFSDFKVDRRADPGEGAGWWVFIPPMPNKAEADKKAGELKRMGVNDYFIVQEAGPNRFAISLGVFSNEAGANDHLASLRTKGVKSAKVGQRVGKDALHTLEVRGAAARQATLKSAVAAAVPEIAAKGCK